VTTRNGSADIILATKDGKELRWLALNSKSREFCPSWSADGKHIVYMLQTETPADGVPLELCIRDVETPKTTNGEKRQSNPLTKKPRVLVSYPFWYGLIGVCSANSDYIAFIKKDMPSEIWKIRLDGSNLQRVSDFRKKGISPSYLVAPSWAPKGDRLAFVTKSKRPLAKDVYEDGIWILDVKTGSATEIPLPPVKD
jgi:Tol biopolymer transport system component